MGKISLQHRLEYWGYLLIEKAICSLPDAVLPYIGRFLAFLAFYVVKIRRQVTLDNLRIAFPEQSHQWYKKTAFKTYCHFAQLILEFMKMNVWSPEKIRHKVQILNGQELLKNFKNGKRVILISGHFGNWEMGIGLFHTFGEKTAVIQQRQNNLLVNERMKKLREKWGMKIIYPRGAVRNCEQALSEGYNVGLLGDQDAGDRGVYVPFFGKMSSSHVGAAVLHLRTGAPMFFIACPRVDRQKIILECHRLPDYAGEEITEDKIKKIIACYFTYLENSIRQFPEQYFWMHRRWKSTINSTSS